ncbi:MAG: hypothetical protein U0223_16870 [Nitrospira sp.]|nr:hypothetical protein [Nitrospira sp.]
MPYKDKAKKAAAQRRYRERHKERLAAHAKQYRATHLEARRAYDREYYQRRKAKASHDCQEQRAEATTQGNDTPCTTINSILISSPTTT